MRAILRGAAAALVLLVGAAPVLAQTADEVIEKYLAASGGREAMARLTSRVSMGTITLTSPAGDLKGTIEVDAKAPNKSRTVIHLDLTALGGGQVVQDQRFDGTTGYVIDSINGSREITGSQLDAMRVNVFPSPFLDYKVRGATAELSGEEAVAGKPAYVVVMTMPGAGLPVRAFVDKDSFMMVRISTKVNVPQAGGDIEQVVDYSDFRDVDGIKLPFVAISTNPLQTVTAKFDSIRQNVDLEDAVFSKPAGQ